LELLPTPVWGGLRPTRLWGNFRVQTLFAARVNGNGREKKRGKEEKGRDEVCFGRWRE